jgi:uncharacterized membrane protein YedE/YeeE
MPLLTSFVTPFFAGFLFGTGLILSGMTNPAKVLAFLDIGGQWDPSLAFVMAGAILVAAIGFRFGARRGRTLSDGRLHVPGAAGIDKRLLLGSLTFGAGWGLVGYCPGPAIAALAVGGRPTLLFVAAMIAGMAVFEVVERLASVRAERLHPSAQAPE